MKKNRYIQIHSDYTFCMNYNRVGISELRVSEICLGTMSWGQQNSTADAFAQMQQLADNTSSRDTTLSEPCLAEIECIHRQYPNPCP
jgi:aryl-alcohol dehydrogenase-like predicted oxidoreductase